MPRGPRTADPRSKVLTRGSHGSPSSLHRTRSSQRSFWDPLQTCFSELAPGDNTDTLDVTCLGDSPEAQQPGCRRLWGGANSVGREKQPRVHVGTPKSRFQRGQAHTVNENQLPITWDVWGRCVRRRPADTPGVCRGTPQASPGQAGRLAARPHPSAARKARWCLEPAARTPDTGAPWGREPAGRRAWAHLAHPRHPRDHQLEHKLVLHRHLGEEEVDAVIPTVHAVWTLSHHVSEDEARFCK